MLDWIVWAYIIMVCIPLLSVMLAIFIATIANFGKGTYYDDEEDAYVVMEDGTVRFDTGG